MKAQTYLHYERKAIGNMEQDIFDKLFSLPILRLFNPLYQKYKSVLLYLFFGVLTTCISIFSFVLCDTVLGIHVLVSNIISWILAVSFAYFTNRTWVFQSSATRSALAKEVLLFFSARISTLLIEEALMWFFVMVLQYDSTVIKLVAQIVVLVLNYVFSKIIVFKKNTTQAK